MANPKVYTDIKVHCILSNPPVMFSVWGEAESITMVGKSRTEKQTQEWAGGISTKRQ